MSRVLIQESLPNHRPNWFCFCDNSVHNDFWVAKCADRAIEQWQHWQHYWWSGFWLAELAWDNPLIGHQRRQLHTAVIWIVKCLLHCVGPVVSGAEEMVTVIPRYLALCGSISDICNIDPGQWATRTSEPPPRTGTWLLTNGIIIVARVVPEYPPHQSNKTATSSINCDKLIWWNLYEKVLLETRDIFKNDFKRCLFLIHIFFWLEILTLDLGCSCVV